MGELAEIAYELSLKGPGITISKNVDAPTAAAIAQMAVGGAARHAAPAHGLSHAPSKAVQAKAGQPLSLREFLQEVNPSIGIHAKILAVGRYIRDFEGRPDFARDDIRAGFRSSGEPQPANFPRDFQKAVKAGWIAEDPKSRGRFYVTRTGDELVDQGFKSSS